jgi:general secretion pathway protein I
MERFSEGSLMNAFMNSRNPGFTLLEVMVAMSIIAIALTALLASQSQSISIAGEAKFSTTAAFLAQSKMAEIETKTGDELIYDSGDFGDDFPDYSWEMEVQDVVFSDEGAFTDYLKQVDLTIYWGEGKQYQYSLRLYHFVS